MAVTAGRRHGATAPRGSHTALPGRCPRPGADAGLRDVRSKRRMFKPPRAPPSSHDERAVAAQLWHRLITSRTGPPGGPPGHAQQGTPPAAPAHRRRHGLVGAPPRRRRGQPLRRRRRFPGRCVRSAACSLDGGTIRYAPPTDGVRRSWSGESGSQGVDGAVAAEDDVVARGRESVPAPRRVVTSPTRSRTSVGSWDAAGAVGVVPG